MGRWARLAAALSFGVAGGVLALPTGDRAAAQGVVKNTFGDWQLRCETPAGAKNEQCALVQSVAAEDRPNVTLLVIVLKTDVGRAGFVRCLTTGCVAEVVMEDNLLDQLKKGQTATFIVFQTPEEGIGIPVSLNGFGPGFDSLP